MEPTIIKFDIQKIAKQNIIWTVFLSLTFILLNSFLQPQSLEITTLAVLKGFTLFCVLYVVLIVSHETFHLIGFWLFGKVPFNSMDYGINLKLGVAYATTSLGIPNTAMKKALLLPFWLTGVIPTLIGFWLNNSIIIIAGAFLLAGAVGDFAMYKELRRFPKDALVKDDPKEPKLYVYTHK